MNTYLDAIALLSSLSIYDPNRKNIYTNVGINSIYGASVFYTFIDVGMNFYNVISKQYMKSTYEHYAVQDMHDSYDIYLLPDGSLVNIPASTAYGAWVTIPIKKS